LFVLAACCALAGHAADRLNVLLLGSGGDPVRERKDWRLKQTIEETGRFEVRIAQDLPAELSRYDAVLVNTGTGTIGDSLKVHARSGKGVVVVRAGTGVAPDGRAIQVDWTDREHPIAAGLAASFRTVDRPLKAKLPQGAKALASVAGTPVAWASMEGKGRIVETVLGQDPALVEEPGFLNLVMRSLEWTATGRCTLEPAGHGTVKGNPVRVLLVTGGHDYAPSFYDVFTAMPGVSVMLDPHPFPYRKGDLREKYDVLVLYDSMQEIPEPERKVLVDFLESGKGLVVLHHALVDYCNWKWWYEEVVGGRWYQTDDKPPRWKTTWKDDVEMLVYPAAQHPVTEGVGLMHIVDETYKGMWLSPDNKVLMRTDDPSSDGPVAWISPYRKSRVVAIELGHGPTAHRHPGFQRLVANAVLWVGKAK
jgi:type 1 glutamine amidotransferase